MAYNKVDFSLKMSKETALRFNAITDAMNLTNEEALSYLLDLYDKVKPELNGLPGKCPLDSHLHTCVRPEIRAKFRQLAQEYGLSYDQMLSVLIEVHDRCPECMASQAAWDSGMAAAGDAAGTEGSGDAMDGPEAGTAAESGTSAESGDSGDAMAKLEAALAMIHDAFLSMASGGDEVASLREQLARSQAEARKAKETYQRKLQAIAAQLQELA